MNTHSDNRPKDNPRWIRNPMDFTGGIIVIALACIGYYAASDLVVMGTSAFDARTAPSLICYILFGLGIVICINSLLHEGPALPSYNIHRPLMITASVVVFALLLEPVGLVVTSVVVFLLTSLASKETRWVEAAVASVLFAAANAFLFVYFLGLQFDLWPEILR